MPKKPSKKKKPKKKKYFVEIQLKNAFGDVLEGEIDEEGRIIIKNKWL